MKLSITFPHDGIEGHLQLTDATGQPIEQVFDAKGNPLKIGGATWTPEFLMPNARPYVLYLETVNKQGTTVQRSVVTLSGVNGTTRLYDRTAPVEAQIDTKGQQPKRGKKD